MRAARLSYVGGPGDKLYVPIEMARHVDLAQPQAGAGLGLPHVPSRRGGFCDAGYTPSTRSAPAPAAAPGTPGGVDESSFEVGLSFAVKLEKSCDFIGRATSLAARGQPLRKKQPGFGSDDEAIYAWGDDAIVIDGRTVGDFSSVG